MNIEQVAKKIKESNPLDFGTIFNDSIELFKKVWLQGFIVLLLTFVLILPFYLLAYFPIIITAIMNPEMLEQEEPDALLILLMFVMIPVVLVGAMGVGIALNASFLRICRLKDLEEIEKEDYFYFLKKKNLVKLVELSLITIGLAIGGVLLCGFGMFYFMVPILLIPAFFAFNEDLSSMEITKASFQLGNKNWLVIFGLVFVMGLIAQLGMFLCFVGVLFTASLSKVPVYYFYKNSIGFNKESSSLLN